MGIISLISLMATGTYAGAGLYALNQVDYQFKSYRIKSVDTQFVHMEVVLNVINPSNLDVHITGYNLHVDINGIEVANLISKSPVNLKGLGVSPLTIPIAIDFRKSFDVIKSKEILGYFITRKKDKIVLSLKGKFFGKILKIPISTNVDFKYSLQEIEDLMKPTVKKV